MVRVRDGEGESTLRLQRTNASLAVAAVLALVGCGGSEDYANDPRPPTTINVGASILPEKVSVSPPSFGAGPVVFLIANLTDEAQRVTVETEALASGPGIKQTTSAINPGGTAQLKLDLKEGDYAVTVDGEGIKEAKVEVGGERESSQDELLQP